MVYGLTGIVALLVLNAVLSYQNVRQLDEDARWVVHTHQVMDALNEMLGHLHQAEVVQRTYLITGGGAMPPAFDENIDAARQKLRQVKALTQDNLDQQARIPEIDERIETLAGAWSSTALVRQVKGFDAARQIVHMGTNQSAAAELQPLIQQMDDAERTLLRDRQATTDRAYENAVVTCVLTAALGLAAVAMFFWLLQRHLQARRDAAAFIHQQQQLLHATLTSVGDGMIATDTAGRVTFLNPVAQELTGWASDAAVGLPLDKVFNIINEKSRKTVDNPALRALKEGVVVGLANHTVLIARDGAERPIDDSAAPIRDRNGDLAGAVLVFRDITERKQAEAALLQSQQRERERAAELEAVLQATPAAIWIAHDPQCQRITGNAASFKLLEIDQSGDVPLTASSPRAHRRPFQEFHNGRPVPPHELPVQRSAAAGIEVNGAELALVFKDGTVKHIYGNAVPLLNQDGSPRGSIAAFMDVSNLKQAEEALKESDHRKNEFLATLAHELRNPLAPIRNGLQLMRIASDDRDAVEQARILMERQMTQLVRLVDDLMDVSRISRGKIELRREQLELAAVVDSAVETSRPVIEEMGHQINVTLPKTPVIVDADLTRLAQVFLNLLNNAAKYTERGGQIWLTAERQGSDVVVSVKDTGIGIAADQLPRIFEMFSQVHHSVEKAQGGLGIGLTLVKRLVEMHGGRIEVRSEGLGKGSEFIVRLPVVVEASKPKPPDNEEEPAALKFSLRILIVDDNRDSADSLSIMLRIMGNETRTAYDGHEAVAAAAEFRPEVVLLDIGLPKMTGYEACRHIREQPDGKNVVIIAQTGWGQEEDRQRTHEAGFDHHMVKPVDPSALMKLLAELQQV